MSSMRSILRQLVWFWDADECFSLPAHSLALYTNSEVEITGSLAEIDIERLTASLASPSLVNVTCYLPLSFQNQCLFALNLSFASLSSFQGIWFWVVFASQSQLAFCISLCSCILYFSIELQLSHTGGCFFPLPIFKDRPDKAKNPTNYT